MFTLMIVLFVLGYVCIALEHPLHLNKTATALLLGTVLWTLLAIGGESPNFPDALKAFEAFKVAHPGAAFGEWLAEVPLIQNLGEVAQILFFLLGAMTTVELVDAHGGFRLITDRIHTTKKVTLLWVIGFITFFMSAILDNLTTAIVMIALLRKLVADKEDRWFYAGIVILAANAGGAWSPIGDVTTIMLWVANKFTPLGIVTKTFAASTVSLVVPMIALSFILKGKTERPVEDNDGEEGSNVTPGQRLLVFILGVSALLFVPVFKAITHLPPYLGMLGGVGVLWIVTSIIHKQGVDGGGSRLSVNSVLNRIDTSSILFFLGILMAVNALGTGGHLRALSDSLNSVSLGDVGDGKYYLITTLIGLLSSVVDNVPLVAGAMGMYDGQFPTNHWFWEFLAYAAGTGGSILIIGSAAGVAVMGLEKIDFIWYLRKISWLALLGYLAGAGVYIAQQNIFADEAKVKEPAPVVQTSVAAPIGK